METEQAKKFADEVQTLAKAYGLDKGMAVFVSPQGQVELVSFSLSFVERAGMLKLMDHIVMGAMKSEHAGKTA